MAILTIGSICPTSKPSEGNRTQPGGGFRSVQSRCVRLFQCVHGNVFSSPIEAVVFFFV